jgi:hypothetical protein
MPAAKSKYPASKECPAPVPISRECAGCLASSSHTDADCEEAGLIESTWIDDFQFSDLVPLIQGGNNSFCLLQLLFLAVRSLNRPDARRNELRGTPSDRTKTPRRRLRCDHLSHSNERIGLSDGIPFNRRNGSHNCTCDFSISNYDMSKRTEYCASERRTDEFQLISSHFVVSETPGEVF